MDGIETLKKIEEQGLKSNASAIVALTANAVLGARENYIRNGFDDYLSKPMVLKELVDCMVKYLPPEKVHEKQPESAEETVREFAPQEYGAEVSGSSEEEDRGLSDLSDIGLDTEKGLEYCAGDADLYRDVVYDYATSYGEKRSEIEALYEKEDWKDYETYVHALKSTSRTIGANMLFEEAKALETAATDGDIGYIRMHHKDVMDAYSGLVEKILELEA